MKRADRIRTALRQQRIPALLVSDPDNIFYALGLKRIEGYLFISQDQSVFFTDGRYTTEVKRTIPAGVRVAEITGDFIETFKLYLKKHPVKNVGIESKRMTLAAYQRLTAQITDTVVATTDIIETLRQVKDKQEIAAIRKATQATLSCFAYAEELLASHHFTEYGLALELERFLRLKSEAIAFPPIVACGASSAEPHHTPLKRPVNSDSVILIDMGGVREGYCSDLTRVFIKDRIARVQKIIDIVRKAKDLAIKKVRAGALIADIDKAARNYIESQGYGKNFCHSTGHGIGIHVHEQPSISSRSTGYLKENMVFTIEPAIYLSGRFGIRLEDVVLVTKSGCEVLSTVEK